MTKKRTSGIIYSTNPDFIYNNSGGEKSGSKGKQDLKVWLEKRAGNKFSTVVKGFIGNAAGLEALSKMLKNKCSTGGTAKDGEIILQGDQRDKVIKLLEAEGYNAKKAGG